MCRLTLTQSIVVTSPAGLSGGDKITEVESMPYFLPGARIRPICRITSRNRLHKNTKVTEYVALTPADDAQIQRHYSSYRLTINSTPVECCCDLIALREGDVIVAEYINIEHPLVTHQHTITISKISL